MNEGTDQQVTRAEPAGPTTWQRWVRWQFGPVRTLLLVTLALSLFFIVFPNLDVWFSRQFYDPEIGFPATRVPAFVWLRSLAETILWAIVAVIALSLIVKLILPERASLIAPRTSLFLISSLLIGPALIVNGILKGTWGRPRPVHIEAFGGDLPFVEVWRITDLCDTNCSFVSGEASTAIWLMALALVAPLAWRNRVAIVTLVLAIIFSVNRIAFGGHFLSDVMLSWTLTLLVIVILHHFLFIRPIKALSAERLEAAMTRAGFWLRERLGLRARGPDDDGSPDTGR